MTWQHSSGGTGVKLKLLSELRISPFPSSRLGASARARSSDDGDRL